MRSVGIEPDADAAQSFVAARIWAERKCRAEVAREEVTLDEIWSELTKLVPWLRGVPYISCELQAETEALYGISATLNKIRQVRRRGDRIIFISDTYLPQAFVSERLRDAGFLEIGDKLYTSCEVGLTKASGNLFLHVLSCERVSSDQVSHCGDHELSDCAIPRRLGLSVDPVEFSWNPLEKRLLGSSDGPDDVLAGLAGAARAFRLNSDEQSAESATALHGAVTAPLVLAYASGVQNPRRRRRS